MIKGIGVDVVEIRRIEEMIKKHGDQFLNKVFTDAEIAYCKILAKPPVHFAGRWAAKEAFYKALPSACQKMSAWKSMEVVSGRSEKPALRICDKTLLDAMGKYGIAVTHVSISHEKSLCAAVVILEEAG